MSTTEEAPPTNVEADAAAPPAADADTKTDVEDATPVEPVIPKRVGRPNQDKKNAALEAINQRKKEITAEQRKIKQGRESTRAARNAITEKMKEARSRINEIRNEGRRVGAELKSLYDAKKALRAAQDKRREEAKKARANSRRIASGRGVIDRIRELEMRQQTETLSLQEEKNILRELAELNEAKKLMVNASESKDAGAAASAAAAVAGKDQWAVLNERIAAKQPEREAINERIAAQAKILEGLKAERDAINAASGSGSERIAELSAEYGELNKKAREINDAYFQQRREYQLWANYKRAQDDIKYAAIRAEEAARRAAEKKKFEEEEAKRHPWEAEMALCDALTAQLTALAPEAAGAEEGKGGEGAGAGAGAAGAGTDSGLVQIVKEVEDPWGGLAGGKKKKGKRGKKGKGKGKAAALRFDLKTHECFGKVGLAAPRTHADIAACIAAVRAKKAEYDAKPRPAKKGKKPAAEEADAPAAEATA